jgi:ABC-2 type transport system permease protein
MAELGAKGVIHDLGYRHFDGERLGRGPIARALYVESARGAYGLGRAARSKVMPMLLVAAICLPAFIVSVVTSVTHLHSLPGGYTSYVLKTQAIVMVFVAGQAPASVSRDLRFRVMSLYFSRPLQRLDYVAAKLAALTTAAFVLMTLPLTILFVGALLAKLPFSEQYADYLRALGGAGLTAVVLAGMGLVIAAITPRRGLGVAAIITVLAVLAALQGAVSGIANEHEQHTLAGYASLLSPFTLVHGVQHSVLGAASALPADPPGALGASVFVGVLLLVVGTCIGGLLLRYRRVQI